MEPRVVGTALGPIEVHERGAGKTMVFLHGLLANSDLWTGVAERLAEYHRCILPVLPLGSHTRPLRADARLNPETLADAVAEVIAEVAPDGAMVVANDTGGVIAQLLVTRHPDRATSLVLTSCDAFRNFLPWPLRYIQLLAWTPGGVWLIVQLLRVPLVRRLPIAFGLLSRRPLTNEQWVSFLTPSRRSRDVRRDLARFLRSIRTRYTRQAAASLGAYDRPVLLPWADTKRIFPIRHAYELAEIFPDAEVVPVGESRAFVPHDQPDRLAELIGEFARTNTGG